MKLLFFELTKVFSKKTFILILILCFILNLGVFYYFQINSDKEIYISSDYVSLVNEYSNMPLDEAEQKLNEKTNVYEILNYMNMASDSETVEELQNYVDALDKYKTENPKAYAEAEKLIDSDKYSENEQLFICKLSEQVNYIKSYPDFIDEMYSRAEEQSSFSIFSNQNEFSYKNLYKTADDYQHLSGNKLTIGNDLPVTAALEYNITDYILIALIFLTCIYLFNQERELGLYNLVRSSKNGRLKTVAAKLSSLFIITAAITLVFSLSNFAISSYLYGEFDSVRAIQSISEFRNCIFSVTTGQFCLLSILTKVIALIIISSLFALVFVCVSNSALTYIIGGGILAAEFLLNILIPQSVDFNWLKYINIFYLLDSRFLGSYLNLNIFSNPVTAYQVDLIVFTALFVIVTVITLVFFTLKGQTKNKSHLSVVAGNLISKHLKISGSTKLINGEAYKFLVINKIALFLIAFVIFGIFSSFGNVNYPYSEKSDLSYKEYMEYLSGEITAEKENYIAEQQEYFENLYKRIDEIESDNSLSSNTKDVAEKTIYNILETKGAAFERVAEQYNRLQNLKSIGIDAQFVDEKLYTDFVQNFSREWINLVLSILALLISIPFIFTVEYKKRMIDLIRSARFGKLRLFLCKLSVSFVTLLIIFAVINLPYLIRFIDTFGTDSFSVPIVCLDVYKNSSGTINIIGAFILCLVCYFFIDMFAVSLIILFSVLLKNHMISMVISTIFLLIPCFIIYPYNSFRVGAIFSGSYSFWATLIIFVCLVIALICIIIASLNFTNTKIRRNTNDCA